MAWSRSRAVAAVALMVALALGVGLSGVRAPKADALASITTLTVVEGTVLIDRGGSVFAPAHEGDVVAAGDVIRIGTGASAEITYFEGSSVRVEAETDLRVESLGSQQGTVVGVQTLGRAWTVITKLVTGDSRYDVRVRSSTASVRG